MFFDLIYGDSEGYAAIVTRDQQGELTDTWWFHWPQEKTRMERYVERRNDEDIYNSVNLFSGQDRNKLDAGAKSRTVYADADTCTPDKFRIPPTIAVETSQGRWHCYWVLDSEVRAEAAARESQRVYLAHKKDGCDAGWAISKLLRVPDTTNLKRGKPEPVTASYYPDNIYSLSTFQNVYTDVNPVNAVSGSADLPAPIAPADFYILETRVESAGLGSLYYETPAEGQRWFELMYRLELDLFREGFTPEEVYWIMDSAACNKYKRDNRDPLDLWKDVQKAYSAFEDDETVAVPKVEGQETVIQTDFLTLEERAWIKENPSFVQEYLAWATSKTDAEPEYHKSLAYMLLANVFGGRAQLAWSHGSMPLNLWITIAGDTTLTRKSTAANLFKTMLHKYETVAAIKLPIDVGADVTAEGVTTKLGELERDGMPAVMFVDEIHGWIGGTKTKNHMAGTLERLTDIYGGSVPVVVRATAGKGNPNRNSTSLSLVGIGIRATLGEVLTKEDFASGFLARMLWVIGDKPAYHENMGELPFVAAEQLAELKASFDPERDSLVRKLHTASRKVGDYDKERVILFDSAARARMNKWSKEITKQAYFSSDSELLLPTFDRMVNSVAKVAACLALYNGRDKVAVDDVLHALAQAELWFRDTSRMLEQISSSDYEKKLDELELFISTGSGGRRSDAVIRRKFARYRASEYDDLINSLRKQGRVRYDPQDRKYLEAM